MAISLKKLLLLVSVVSLLFMLSSCLNVGGYLIGGYGDAPTGNENAAAAITGNDAPDTFDKITDDQSSEATRPNDITQKPAVTQKKPAVTQKPVETTRAPAPQNPSAPSSNTEWGACYLEYIKSLDDDEIFPRKYALIFIDDDNIPELYVSGTFEAEGDLVCTYKNGKLVIQRLFRMYGGRYIERSGKLINDNGNFGSFYVDLYVLGENGFVQTLEAQRLDSIMSESGKPSYSVNGKSVTKEEYDSAIAAEMDMSAAKALHRDAVLRAEIIQQLAKY